MTTPAAPSSRTAETRRTPAFGGVAAGVALVLVAVLIGVLADGPSGDSGSVAPAAGVVPTGDTTTVTVTADHMRFIPDTIEVAAGDRLVIELTNLDHRRHDLIFGDDLRTPILRTGESYTFDVGVVGADLAGWCSLPAHQQAGMTFSVVVSGSAGPTAPTSPVDPMRTPDPEFTAHDPAAPATPNGQVHRHEIRAAEVVTEVAPGVEQLVWTFNGTVPGPVLRGKIGDTFEITFRNDGTVDHGIDFHAGALAPDEPMRPIDPGEELTYTFTADRAGIFMYHCSTMPMLHHIGNGMYGAVIIDPPDLPPVDQEFVLVQSELYLGPDGEIGDLTKMRTEQPDAVVFNGYVAQYAHRPLAVGVADRVRVWVLNAGPNRASAFHIVGAVFDTVYREGRWDLRPTEPGGAQVLDLAPAAGGFVEIDFPEAGRYPFVTHVVIDAERGAAGTFDVTETPTAR